MLWSLLADSNKVTDNSDFVSSNGILRNFRGDYILPP